LPPVPRESFHWTITVTALEVELPATEPSPAGSALARVVFQSVTSVPAKPLELDDAVPIAIF